MDKKNLKKLALLGMTGGLVLSVQSQADAAIVNNTNAGTFLAAGCGHQCNGNSAPQNNAARSNSNKSYTADASTDEPMQPSGQTGANSGKLSWNNSGCAAPSRAPQTRSAYSENGNDRASCTAGGQPQQQGYGDRNSYNTSPQQRQTYSDRGSCGAHPQQQQQPTYAERGSCGAHPQQQQRPTYADRGSCGAHPQASRSYTADADDSSMMPSGATGATGATGAMGARSWNNRPYTADAAGATGATGATGAMQSRRASSNRSYTADMGEDVQSGATGATGATGAGKVSYSSRPSKGYAADAGMDSDANSGSAVPEVRSSSVQSNPDYNRPMTETELLTKLSDAGKAMYESLDDNGKAFALRLAGQPNIQNKDQAVKIAVARMNQQKQQMQQSQSSTPMPTKANARNYIPEPDTSANMNQGKPSNW